MLALLGVAACGPAVPPDGTVVGIEPTLPAGYPPKIGDVTADLGGRTRGWDLYDYSIGAYDASVQVYDNNGQATFRLMGQQVGKPDTEVDRLVIGAEMTAQTQTGALAKPVIEIVAGRDWDGGRLSSVGSTASVVLDSLTPMGPQGTYGHVTGHFSAVLCAATGNPARVDKAACQPFKGTFDSDLQIGGP